MRIYYDTSSSTSVRSGWIIDGDTRCIVNYLCHVSVVQGAQLCTDVQYCLARSPLLCNVSVRFGSPSSSRK